VLSLHEILHDTKSRKKRGLILKLDFEKAYDKLNWEFLLDCLIQRGFPQKCCSWIRVVLTSGTLSVKANDKRGPYFKSGKGVRQGDPLSPLLFNIAADSLAKMVTMGQSNNIIGGLITEYVHNGIALLQYADDTILCLQDEDDSAQNMKPLLYLFEQMSGLKTNFDKSEVIIISQDERKTLRYAKLFNCSTGQWPLKYLGVPVCGSRLHIKDLLQLDEKLHKKLGGWKGNSLSFGGRLTLLNACLSSIPIYSMSMYLLPKTILKKIDVIRKRFFWQGGNVKRKYHLVKWLRICQLKKKGSLGVKDLWKMNISLMCKWWWKLERSEGLWQEIVRKKYVNNCCLISLKNKPTNSPVWNQLLSIKDIYIGGKK